uniref:Uncharacterized protein n=1 Tax=uncultured organism TaxID=155900 RepID=A0A385FVB0_9ZZZZ|nr:hypothetical protein TRI8_00026 [uncultured organism]
MLHQVAVFFTDPRQAEQSIPIIEDAVHQIVGNGFELRHLNWLAFFQIAKQFDLHALRLLIEATDALFLFGTTLVFAVVA